MYLYYMECSHPFYEIEERLGGMCLRLNTDSEIDYIPGRKKMGQKRGNSATGDWIEVESFRTIKEKGPYYG